MKSTKLVALATPALCAIAVLTGALATRVPRSAASARVDTGGVSGADPRAAIFLGRGCQECHAISALGVAAASDVGPDLSFAYADVVNRYAMNLQAFFDNPPGMMRLVLASHLRLTRADRDSMTHILTAVYHERLADMDPEIPSFPPARARPAARRAPIPQSPSRN